MAKARINQVAAELLTQARSGNLGWEPVENRDTAYRVSFSNTALIVSRWSPLHNAAWSTVREFANSISVDLPTYRLELLNQEGEVVESLLTVPGQMSYRNLKEVYDLAHKQASNTEDAIDQVLQHLTQTQAG